MEQTGFQELIEEFRKIKAQLQSAGQELLHKTFREVFASNPQVSAIVWEQYTPYFNDGDPCEFRVGDPTIVLNGGPEDFELVGYGEYDGDNPAVKVMPLGYIRYTVDGSFPGYLKEEEDIFKTLDTPSLFSLYSLFGEPEMGEVFLNVFDDHSSVIATPSGFDVIEFRHD